MKKFIFAFLLAAFESQAAPAIDKTPMYKVVSGKMVIGKMTIESDDTFSVLATQTKPDGTTFVELGIQSDFSYEPEVLWVNAQVLQSIKTEAFDPEAPDIGLNIYDNRNFHRDDDGTPLSILMSDNPELLGDLVLTEVAGKGGVKRHHHGGRVTHCLRDVRLGLARMKICNSSSFGETAGHALDDIESQCKFTPVPYSENMPKGAVCVSQGGKFNCGHGKQFEACGHAALSDGKGNWIGAGIRKSPMLSGHSDVACAEPSSAVL